VPNIPGFARHKKGTSDNAYENYDFPEEGRKSTGIGQTSTATNRSEYEREGKMCRIVGIEYAERLLR